MVQPSAAKLETKPNYCEVSIFAIYTDLLNFQVVLLIAKSLPRIVSRDQV